MDIHTFAKKRPYLFWYTKNVPNLSEPAIVEAVLNYGDFDDVKKIMVLLGKRKVARIFQKQIKGKRINYEPKIVNYFTIYFKKHA